MARAVARGRQSRRAGAGDRGADLGPQRAALALGQGADEFLGTQGDPWDTQTDMAMAVCQTLEQGGQLVVEAGTGVGKTYAYLVPVLLSGQRALVSTATKALQDQLFSRDIPRLVEVLGLPIRVALLKGRS